MKLHYKSKAGFRLLDAMTSGVVKTTVDTIEIGFFFGNAVKFVKSNKNNVWWLS